MTWVDKDYAEYNTMQTVIILGNVTAIFKPLYFKIFNSRGIKIHNQKK